MRLRNIPGAKDAITESPYVVQNPAECKGKWEQVFTQEQPIHIEVGMGKGRFLMDMAKLHPEINYIGIEMYDSVLLRALQKREKLEEAGEKLDNLKFMCVDARLLPEIFEKVDHLLDGEELDLIIGGPPCQAYSLAGRSRSETKMVGDKRNYLYRHYAEFLRKYRPKYFVFENVLGLLSAKDEDGSRHFDNMLKLFKEYGYSTEFRPLNASDYGVLQNRKRIILIGKRGEYTDFYPNIPREVFQYKVGELLCDLPSIHAGEGVITPVATKPYSGKYLFLSGIKESDGEAVTFHQARPNTNQDLEIYRIVVEAWNKNRSRVAYTDLPEHLRTHKNTSFWTVSKLSQEI